MMRSAVWLMLLGALVAPAWADDDPAQRLRAIERERAAVEALARRIEQRLGATAAELRRLDQALLDARRAAREAEHRLAEAERALVRARRARREAARKAARLKEQMLAVAASAWRRGGLDPSWAWLDGDAAGASHRRAMAERVLRLQAEMRARWLAAREELAAREAELAKAQAHWRAQLEARRKAVRRLARARSEKRRWLATWRRRQAEARQRAARLAREAAALKMLLDELAHGLGAAERQVEPGSVRRLRGRLPWPVTGRVVVGFGQPAPPLGRPLDGLLIAPARNGEDVRAVAAGQVRFVGWLGGLGLIAVVDHGDGVVSVYAHNDAVYRRVGDWVEAGEPIARVGSTGWVTRRRLYFALRERGRAVDPRRWLVRR